MFDSEAFSLHRLDAMLGSLARYEIRDSKAALVGRAEEECRSRWLRALKVTKLRTASPLRLRVEIAHPPGSFFLERAWDWVGTRPTRVRLPDGTPLFDLRQTRLAFGEAVIEGPDQGRIGTVATLQPIVLWDRLYELRDGRNRPVARWRWFVESWWRPPRRCEVRLEDGAPPEPWSFVALAASLYVALGVSGR